MTLFSSTSKLYKLKTKKKFAKVKMQNVQLFNLLEDDCLKCPDIFVIFCGDERIPFLRAAFGNNDNVDAKVTFGRLEQTLFTVSVNGLLASTTNR